MLKLFQHSLQRVFVADIAFGRFHSGSQLLHLVDCMCRRRRFCPRTRKQNKIPASSFFYHPFCDCTAQSTSPARNDVGFIRVKTSVQHISKLSLCYISHLTTRSLGSNTLTGTEASSVISKTILPMFFPDWSRRIPSWSFEIGRTWSPLTMCNSP
jgi:hypothetical protein